MKVLGISAYYHDSAAALTINGLTIAAAQEERFSRKKHDASFPTNAIKYCLDHQATSPHQIDAIVFYDKPLLKFERLLETYYSFAPKGLFSFQSAIPVWLKDKMFLKRQIKTELKAIGFEKIPKLLFTEHHLSHAASAFYPSGFKEAAILTIDGVGEWATASICYGNDGSIKVLKELKFPHSLGLLYSAFTYFLGFKVNSGEYKLMGLAPYGNPVSTQVQLFEEIILTELVDLKEDGSVFLNQKYFTYTTGLRMVSDKQWQKLFNMSRRLPDTKVELVHCNLALAIQRVTEKVVQKMAVEAKKLTNSENLCLAGGVALNCVSNGKLLSKKLFKNVFIQPAAGDAGGALGAALATEHIYFNQERVYPKKSDKDLMFGAFLGPSFSEKEILAMVNKYEAIGFKVSYHSIYKTVAEALNSGLIVGWMQGRMEFGPRALGCRSILADARDPQIQKKLNLKIKNRESFRPFAPSVLAEDANKYFDLTSPSPYMLQTQPVLKERCRKKPDNYYEQPILDKLYFERSDLPAITHIDYSARIQTVHKETNEHYHNLISAFKALTGCSVVVNTSFNVRGEPIVCTPEDAYSCFMNTEIDLLVIGQYLFHKKDQPHWSRGSNIKSPSILD